MSVHDQVSLLRRIPLFSNVDESHLKVLAFATERVVLEAGDILVREGENATAAFVIVDGEAEASAGDSGFAKRKIPVERSAFIGEISMLSEQGYAATVRATSRLEALKITRDLFFRVINEFPEMAVQVMHVVNRRLNGTLSDLDAVQRSLNEPDR